MSSDVHERTAHCWALYVDASRLLKLSEGIAKRADVVNSTAFARFFGGLQADYGSLTLLRLAALYDTSSNTHSIPHLLKLLAKTNIDPSITTSHLMTCYGLTDDGPEHWKNTFLDFAKSYEQEPLSSRLRLAKRSRNKSIAHVDRQATPPAETPTYDEARDLIEHARRTINLAGALYLRKQLAPHDQFGSTFSNTAAPLDRLIDHLGGNAE